MVKRGLWFIKITLLIKTGGLCCVHGTLKMVIITVTMVTQTVGGILQGDTGSDLLLKPEVERERQTVRTRAESQQ